MKIGQKDKLNALLNYVIAILKTQSENQALAREATMIIMSFKGYVEVPIPQNIMVKLQFWHLQMFKWIQLMTLGP